MYSRSSTALYHLSSAAWFFFLAPLGRWLGKGSLGGPATLALSPLSPSPRVLYVSWPIGILSFGFLSSRPRGVPIVPVSVSPPWRRAYWFPYLIAAVRACPLDFLFFFQSHRDDG